MYACVCVIKKGQNEILKNDTLQISKKGTVFPKISKIIVQKEGL